MQSTNASKRIRLLERKEYGIDLEYNADFIIIHLPYLWEFNKGVFVEMMFSLEDFSSFFKTIGFEKLHAAVDRDNLKIQRLLVKLGFTFVGRSDGLNVYERIL